MTAEQGEVVEKVARLKGATEEDRVTLAWVQRDLERLLEVIFADDPAFVSDVGCVAAVDEALNRLRMVFKPEANSGNKCGDCSPSFPECSGCGFCEPKTDIRDCTTCGQYNSPACTTCGPYNGYAKWTAK